MTTRETSRTIRKIRSSFALIGFFLIMAAVVAVPFYSARSSSLSRGSQASAKSGTPAKPGKVASRAVSGLPSLDPGSSLFTPAPAPFAEGIATFASDCITPQSDFNLGDVVCAKASGVPVTLFPWHVLWIDTAGFVRQSDDAVANDQYEYRYTLPATATSDVDGQTVNNLGTWKVNLTRSNGAVRQTARFVVHQPANPSSDVFVQKFVHSSSASVSSGENISFTLVVGNAGPDGAAVVHLIDSVPTGASLVQFTQNSGPDCLPAGTGNCTIATMANGDSAEFTAIYNTGSMAPGDYETSATVSSTTPDPDSSNNSSTAQFAVTPSNGTTDCQLICPENINANADTTEGGQRGAHVTYPEPVSSGDCGSVSSVPASGSFFPVGQTAVTATSETGNGSCSFTVTITDNGTNPPNITCPANKTADANGDCEATVVLGTPTTSGDNVTVVGSRSDGKPMYDCDVNGNNCTRKNPDLPFSAGVTTVTWTATSHDAQGNETGNASCQQTVTVNDTTPPVITAVDQTASADANCQAAVPDYSNQVSDNCACASNDNSQDCVGQHRITTTQDPAAGTLLGPGTYTIHLTANDGSSNNDGAGNTTTKDVTFTVRDTTAPTITCPPNMTANAEPGTCSAHVVTGTATATDNCDASPTITGTRSDGKPLTDPYPGGTTTITWTATDSAGNHSSCDQTITVVDVEPPVIVLNGQTPSMWPPNHRYRTFGVANFVTGVTDNCDTIGVSSVVITMVTSDEIENGNGDGNTLNDIVIAPDCRSVQLRAEREGNSNGRVYRIFFMVTDASGNVGTASATVVVRHNPGETPIDSGPHYTVTCGGL
ncbi:MAG: hypothetical protein QOG23_2206 [Blastocatellia bacterium]|nr:hypothetical protein [Blastocatellia bacterium]